MAVPTRFRIRGARLAAGLTQEALARLIGCAVMSVSRWELGTTKEPPAKFLGAAASALGVSAEWLAWGNGKPCESADDAARVMRFVRMSEREAA
jgi:transcriptional regulator with XRE-family HTH domain